MPAFPTTFDSCLPVFIVVPGIIPTPPDAKISPILSFVSPRIFCAIRLAVAPDTKLAKAYNGGKALV